MWPEYIYELNYILCKKFNTLLQRENSVMNWQSDVEKQPHLCIIPIPSKKFKI